MLKIDVALFISSPSPPLQFLLSLAASGFLRFLTGAFGKEKIFIFAKKVYGLRSKTIFRVCVKRCSCMKFRRRGAL